MRSTLDTLSLTPSYILNICAPNFAQEETVLCLSSVWRKPESWRIDNEAVSGPERLTETPALYLRSYYLIRAHSVRYIVIA